MTMDSKQPHRYAQDRTGPRTAYGAILTLAFCLILTSLQGCSTNPATGNKMFSVLSEKEEISLGQTEHPKLVKSFGGIVPDPALEKYVSSVGQLLARTSELPNLKFTFTLLNSSVVNAFALPGGYVYISRGLLAIANSEAELAGVLAHEIGHITARHTAQRYSQGVFTNLGVNVIGILTGSQGLAQLVGTGAGLYLRSYSRTHEFEADTLGVRYLKRAGFKPEAMASFLKSLRAHSRLSAKLKNLEPGKIDEFDILSTHPRTIERVTRAAKNAGGAPVADPIIGRDVFLKKISGMIYGDSPDQGFVRGREFFHPDLRVHFKAPEGFHLTNSPTQVMGRGSDGAVLTFDQASKAGRRGPYDYLINVWAKNTWLADRKKLTINGMKAAMGSGKITTKQGQRSVRLVVVRMDRRNLFRMMFLTKPTAMTDQDPGFIKSAKSFAKASLDEVSKWKPLRIKLYKVKAGDTVKTLAGKMALEKEKEDHFRVINGLGPKEKLTVGKRIKLVTIGGH
ncbi:MAG: M48 family metalloprotease [Alphaproteobacteria bacterium]|jgi:predicted Zn-dependent protease